MNIKVKVTFNVDDIKYEHWFPDGKNRSDNEIRESIKEFYEENPDILVEYSYTVDSVEVTE